MAGNARLPKPITTRWEWQYQGACIGMDSMRFFHPEGERGSSRRKRDDDAKAVCRTCEVQAVCLQWALDNNQDSGVWGGMSEEERRSLRRRAARARRAS